jgi:GTP-binding protein
LVDVSSFSGRETVADYHTVNRELAAYNPALAVRPQIVVATKLDALEDPERLELLKQAALAEGHEFLAISAVTNLNVKELVNAVAVELEALKRAGTENSVVELALSE